MKKFTLTFASLCAFCAFAYAGSERYESKEVAPQPVIPSSCFDGWYFGIHGGGILTNFNTETAAFEETLAPNPNGFSESLFQSTGRDDKWTWEGGLHAGRNWQRGGWVFGFEVDFQGTDFEQKDSVFLFMQLPSDQGVARSYTTAIDSKVALDWYATGRVRVGHTLGDKFLAFITAGGAIGLTEVSAVTGIAESTDFGGTFADQFSNGGREVRGGWTAGGGFDFCISEHWLLNFTYLYTDLGDGSAGKTLLFTGDPVESGVRSFDSETRVRTDFKFHVFRGGLTFKF
jgi:outer membrane immunogenic protein